MAIAPTVLPTMAIVMAAGIMAMDICMGASVAAMAVHQDAHTETERSEETMYFDPLSAWLVSLIADGIIIADEKTRGGSASEYEEKRIQQGNAMLNGDIRRIKAKYGYDLPEMALDQVKLHIRVTQNSFPFQKAYGRIVIDLDNQDYIIELLEKCADSYLPYTSVDQFRQKVETYRNEAAEAKRRRAIHAKALEEAQAREAKQREHDQTMSNIYLVVGLIIFFAFIIFFFS